MSCAVPGRHVCGHRPSLVTLLTGTSAPAPLGWEVGSFLGLALSQCAVASPQQPGMSLFAPASISRTRGTQRPSGKGPQHTGTQHCTEPMSKAQSSIMQVGRSGGLRARMHAGRHGRPCRLPTVLTDAVACGGSGPPCPHQRMHCIYIQPPGLMRMSVMHHQEHQTGHQFHPENP